MLERAPAHSLATSLSRLMPQCRTTKQLQQIHSKILTFPHLSSSSAAAALLRRLLFYSATIAAASLPYTTDLFYHLPNPDLSAYNAIIRAHAHPSSPLHPLFLYSSLLAAGLRPNHLTFPFLLKRCSLRPDPEPGQAVHAHVFHLGFHCDVHIQNSAVFFYANCGIIRSAERAFDEMPCRDIVSWNSMLVGFLRCGELDSALALFREMEDRSIRTWNSIITGFVHGGQAKEALGLFHEMQVSAGGFVKPDKITIANVISACASLGALDQGRWVHGYLDRSRLEFDVVIGTALVDMYGKCGCLAEAVDVFRVMPQKDVLAWTAMISSFAIHGLGEEAFALLEEMQRAGVRPNKVTFGALLSACAHAGMVEKGRWCFDVMQRVFSIEPQQQHYASMVDLLGRAGLFEEAEEFIETMPMEPDSFVWGALLGACRMHGNVALGERIASHVILSDPQNDGFHIILSDLYAKARRFDDVKKVRCFMKDQRIKKAVPGCSMIEIDGKVHEFSMKRMPEEVMKAIEWVFSGINSELKAASCQPEIDEELWQIT